MRRCLCILISWLMAWGGASVPVKQPVVPPGLISFKSYGIEEGLLSLPILCLLQDRQGFIWAGSENGVIRYAARQFQTFGTMEGLPSMTILCLLQAQDGTLWAGTARGLAYWKDGAFHGPLEDKGLPNLRISGLAVGPDGQLRIATSAGILTQNGAGRFEADQTWPGGQATALWSARGEFYAAGWRGNRAKVYALRQGVWEALPSAASMGGEVIEALAVDGQHALWARSLQGLWRFQGDRFEPGPATVLRARQRCTLFTDTRGRVWTNTEEGIARLDDGNVVSISQRNGLPTNVVHCILVDREGSLWVAGDGLHRVRGGGIWRSYRVGQGLPDNTVWCIAKDNSGGHWVGTDKGLARMTPKGFEPIRGTESMQVRSIAQGPDGALYLTGSPWILRYDPRNGGLTKIDASSGLKTWKRMFRLFFDHRGHLWVGAEQQGLQRGILEKGAWRFHREVFPGSKPVEDVQDVAEDAAGRIWAASEAGLAMLEAGNWRCFTTRDGLRNNDVSHLRVLRNGDLLGAYLGGRGVFRARYENGSLKVLEHFDELVPPGQSTTYLIGEDAGNGLWIGGQKGLDQITPGRKVIHHSLADGLTGNDVNNMAFLAEANGDVWIGTTMGLSRMEASAYPGIPSPPAVVISAFSLGRNRYFTQPPSALRVPRTDSSFEVQFACPSFIHEDDIQYQVRLRGLEGEWHGTSNLTERFPALLPGKYTFNVRCRIGQGEWGPTSSVVFEVLPSWWQTWWAYVIYGSALLGGLFLLYRLRVRILQRRNAVLQHRITEATKELRERERLLASQAADLLTLNEQKNQFFGIVAHDLRNPLNGIMLSAQLLEDVGDIDEVNRISRRIYSESMEMTSLIERFLDVASIESGNIKAEPVLFDLSELLHQILHRHQQRATAKDIALSLEIAQGDVEAYADPKFMRETLDNLVSNAVKFTPPGKGVVLRQVAKDGMTLVSVEDEGPGLTEEDRTKLFGRFARLSARPTGGEKSIGLGLSIVKHMVDAMGGKIWVESTLGKGTTFTVGIPCCAPQTSGSKDDGVAVS